MTIQTNVSAMHIARNWSAHNGKMSTALERLSSGLRINRAADDPSGMTISERMKAQIRGLSASRDNVLDGMSAVDVADAALAGQQEMLNRMYELAAKAASGTISDSDRELLDQEFQQYIDEIDRTSKSTTYNGITLLKNDSKSPSSNLKDSFGDEKKIDSMLKTEVKEGESIVITGSNLDAFLDGLDSFLMDISKAAANNDSEKLAALGIDRSSGASDKELLNSAILKFTKENASSLMNTPSKNGSGGEYEIHVDGDGISLNFPRTGSDSLGLKDSNLLTQDSATSAMDTVKKAIDKISKQRGDMGGTMNRLEHTLRNIDRMSENLTAACSRITDADMAKEMMNYTKEQALAQACAFLMAQANQQPDEVLSLLKSLE